MKQQRLFTLVLSFFLFVALFTTPVLAADLPIYFSNQSDTGLYYGPPIPQAIPMLASRSGAELTKNLLKSILETLPYRVKKGDSLYSIAASFNLKVDQLIALNKIDRPEYLKVGQELSIPNNDKSELTGNLQIKQVISADLTAYTAGYESTGKHPGDLAYGVTASGRSVQDHHTIAVDPSVIPLGSKVYIEGIGLRVAEDTGGDIIGNRIDVYMNSLPDAINFGYKRNIKIYVLDTQEKTA